MASMMRKRVRIATCILAALPALAFAQKPSPPPISPQLPPSVTLRPLVAVPAGRQPVRLSEARIESEVHAGLVHTRLTLEFINPNPVPIEGEVQFPLHDGQAVSGFSLEMTNGSMMKAVPVAKAKGRQVFEAVERRGVDPALLEQTSGEQFRLKVFPLLAGVPRHVEIELTQALASDGSHRERLRLPIEFGTTVAEKLTVNLSMPTAARQQIQFGHDLEGAEVRQEAGQTLISLARYNFRSKTDNVRSSSLSWPASARDDLTTSRVNGEAYFQASLAVEAPIRARPRPDHILLIWDASASGSDRDHAREIQFLDQLFRWQPDVALQLKVVRETAEPEQTFVVRGGDWHALRQTIEKMVYDGASNAGLWRPSSVMPGKNSMVFLFSDGLGNWGEELSGQEWPVPSFAVRASAIGNSLWLRHWAEFHQGQFIDLAQTDPAAGLAMLRQMPLRLVRIEGDGLKDWVSASRVTQDGRIALAGRLTESAADPVALFEDGSGNSLRKPLHIIAPPADRDSSSDFAAKRWASLRMEALLDEPRLHKREIQALGEQFSLVTPETSLIILESLQDFIRYDARPPVGPLRVAFDQVSQKRDDDKAFARSRHRDELAARYAAFTAWWEQDFPKGDKPSLSPLDTGAETAVQRQTMANQTATVPSPPPSPRPAPIPPPVMMPAPAPAPMAM